MQISKSRKIYLIEEYIFSHTKLQSIFMFARKLYITMNNNKTESTEIERIVISPLLKRRKSDYENCLHIALF